MSLLSRHILRSLAAPFFWGVVALTGLLLLNALAPMINRLGGKGLEWDLIVQAVALTIPALVVLTLPMAALTASLYGFGQLAADMEMVAMYANGVSVWRMARPALIGAFAVAVVNFILFDQFVPTSNARYRGLITAVGNKHPTLALRAGELNRLGNTPYIMRADVIDSGGIIRGVSIYSLSGAEGRRVIRADSGHMRIAANGRDMLMTLYDGTSLDFRPATPGRTEFSSFRSDRITLRDVTNQLQLSGDLDRGDREKSSCQLLDDMVDESWYVNDGNQARRRQTRGDLRRLAGLAPLAPPAMQIKPPPPRHCGLYRRAEDWLQRKLLTPEALQALVQDSIRAAEIERIHASERAAQEASAREAARRRDAPAGVPLPPTPGDTSQRAAATPVPPDSAPPGATTPPDSLATGTVPPDSLGARIAQPPQRPDSQVVAGTASGQTPELPAGRSIGVTPNDPALALLARDQDFVRTPQVLPPAAPNDILTTVIELEGARQEARGATLKRASYRVEFHKKYAIPLASLCFVLLGLALALKYPQGGIGMVIGGSLLIFMMFYVMIQAGEALAKKELVDPRVAIYGPLVLFSLAGIMAVSSANREMGSTRSGGLVASLGEGLASLRQLLFFWRRQRA